MRYEIYEREVMDNIQLVFSSLARVLHIISTWKKVALGGGSATY